MKNYNYEEIVTCVIDELLGIQEALKKYQPFKAYAFKLDFDGDLKKLSIEDIRAAFELLDEAEGNCWYVDRMFQQYMLAW